MAILTTQVILLILACVFVNSRDISFVLIVETVIFPPDGYPLPVIKVYENGENQSRPFPGPLINATIGDTLHVNVQNNLMERTSLHFHGIHMKNEVWMDGVVDITECGIWPGSNFTYSFKLTQTGTYWYHSHKGSQYGDGLFGPLVINYPEGEDPVFQEYNYHTEHIVILQDWLHEVGNDVMLLYRGPYTAYSGFVPKYPWPPQSFLINGNGHANCIWDDCSWVTHNDSKCAENPQCFPIRPPYFGNCTSNTDSTMEFNCPSEEYVRIRIINAGSNLPSRFWIDRHNMTIVAKDGVETEPLIVEYITIPVAQRIDVIIHCDQDSRYNYRIFSAIPAAFITGGANYTNIWAEALLIYSKSTGIMEPSVTPNDRYRNQSDDLFFEYGLKPRDSTIAPAATRRILLLSKVAWDENKESGSLEEWTINNITFLESKQPFLPAIDRGAKRDDIIASKPGVAGNLRKSHIINVKYGETVEVVLISNDQQQHPWHLHGYSLYFVKAGNFTINPYKDDCGHPFYYDGDVIANVEESLDPYDQEVNVTTIGDTFTVPGYGYVAFRFTATNPGPWYLHCHVEWHLGLGMSLILSVQNDDGTYPNIGPIPPSMVPQCCVFPNLKHSDTSYWHRGLITAVVFDFILGVSFLIAICCICFRKKKQTATNRPH